MASLPASEKSELRRRVRALRDAAPADQRAQWSAHITVRAVSHPAYVRARTVHVFLSFQSEVDTTGIIEHALMNGKRVVAPIFLSDSDETPATQITTISDDAFEFGRWGMRTPRNRCDVPLEEIDVVFVPLVCFGAAGGGRWARIGYGAGYYDRMLVRLRTDVPRIGLAFALQRLDHLPIESHDALLDDVLYEAQ